MRYCKPNDLYEKTLAAKIKMGVEIAVGVADLGLVTGAVSIGGFTRLWENDITAGGAIGVGAIIVTSAVLAVGIPTISLITAIRTYRAWNRNKLRIPTAAWFYVF